MRLQTLLAWSILLCTSVSWLRTVEAAEYVYYVNPNNVNSTAVGDGSQANPYSSISQALDSVTVTDTVTIYLSPGAYRGAENVGLTYSAATVSLVGSGYSGVEESSIDCRGTGIGMIVTSVGFSATNISVSTCQTAVAGQEFALLSFTEVLFKDTPGTAVTLDDTYLFECDDCRFENVRNNSISGTVYTFALVGSTLSGPPGTGSIGGGISLELYTSGSIVDSTFLEVVGLLGSDVSTQALQLRGGIWHIENILMDGCALRLNSDSPTPDNVEVDEDSTDGLGGAMLLLDDDNFGTFAIYNSSFIDCFSYQDGGAVAVGAHGNVTIDNTLFDGNRAVNGGGVYLSSNASVVIHNAVFSFNEASQDGGGMFLQDGSVAYLDGCIFNFNSADASASDLACCSNTTESCSASVFATNTTIVLDEGATTCDLQEWDLSASNSDDGDDNDSGLEWYDIALIVLSAIGVVVVLVGLIGFSVAFLLYKRRMHRSYEVVDD